MGVIGLKRLDLPASQIWLGVMLHKLVRAYHGGQAMKYPKGLKRERKKLLRKKISYYIYEISL